MKLLNVRLSVDDARKTAQLRSRGVRISGIVREAIRAAYDAHVTQRAKPRRGTAIMAEIYAQFPDPPNLPPAPYHLRDRRSVRSAIVEKMGQRRR